MTRPTAASLGAQSMLARFLIRRHIFRCWQKGSIRPSTSTDNTPETLRQNEPKLIVIDATDQQ